MPPKSKIQTCAEEMVAFWRYDHFPFVLGGHVTKLRGDGAVETRQYDLGNFFKPFRILPKGKGEEALVQLHNIREEHNKATRVFNKEWQGKLLEILPWVGDVQ